MKHIVYDIRGRDVGFWDDAEIPRIYHTFRRFSQNQIFKSHYFNNEVGIDLRIIKKVLIPNNIFFLDYFITGFENASFHTYMELKRFLELGREVNYEGKQIIVPLKYFDRQNPKEKLKVY